MDDCGNIGTNANSLTSIDSTFDRRYDLLYKSENYLYLIHVFNTEMSFYSIFLNLLRGMKRALKILRKTN